MSFDEELIRTELGYRENANNPQEPRVTVADLAKHVGNALGIKPDEKTMNKANQMFGIGSALDLEALAWMKPLMEVTNTH